MNIQTCKGHLFCIWSWIGMNYISNIEGLLGVQVTLNGPQSAYVSKVDVILTNINEN